MSFVLRKTTWSRMLDPNQVVGVEPILRHITDRLQAGDTLLSMDLIETPTGSMRVEFHWQPRHA